MVGICCSALDYQIQSFKHMLGIIVPPIAAIYHGWVNVVGALATFRDPTKRDPAECCCPLHCLQLGFVCRMARETRAIMPQSFLHVRGKGGTH